MKNVQATGVFLTDAVRCLWLIGPSLLVSWLLLIRCAAAAAWGCCCALTLSWCGKEWKRIWNKEKSQEGASRPLGSPKDLKRAPKSQNNWKWLKSEVLWWCLFSFVIKGDNFLSRYCHLVWGNNRSPKGNMWSAIPVALLWVIVKWSEGTQGPSRA